MDDISIVIVDDSSFSVAYIKDVLETNKFKVVGDADSLEKVKAVVKEKRPTVVTMDITLPGTDGFECTRAVHEIDKNIKVIIVSSMMDDEMIKKAKENNVSAYIQKPVDPQELITAINRVMASEKLFNLLQDCYFAVFKETLMDCLNRMTKTIPQYQDEHNTNCVLESEGMTVIIGVIGKFSGRMLLDFSMQTAHNLVSGILKRQPKNNDEISAVLGEFSNIVSGNACSILNKQNNAFGLRVSPPAIFHGDKVHILTPCFKTTNVTAKTAFGDMLLSAGFQRGDNNWI